MPNFFRAASLRFVRVSLFSLVFLFVSSCGSGKPVAAFEKEELFDLHYGSFENELSLFDLRVPGEIRTSLVMNEGFFYIANAEAAKIMELTSYGDLIGILYNADKNPVPSFVTLSGSKTVSALDSSGAVSTQHAVAYPFNSLSALAVDSGKRLYAADILPRERFVFDEKTKTVLRSAVLRFENDGSFIDYLGQEGPGGTPFPYIKSIYTTKQNELVVVCLIESGYSIFWFSRDGYLKYKVPVQPSSFPPYEADNGESVFVSLEQVIPDYTQPVLYLKIDYYPAEIDASTRVQSGMKFDKTLLYPLNLETGLYGEPIAVPDFEQTVTYGYTKEVFSMSYDFLGVTEMQWFFFITTDETGFSILMLKENGQKIIRRHLDMDMGSVVYHNFSLSPSGIISALIAREDKASVMWWRTDTLIAAIIK
jgi:putative lipoprotein